MVVFISVLFIVCTSRVLWRYVKGLLHPKLKKKPVFHFFFFAVYAFIVCILLLFFCCAHFFSILFASCVECWMIQHPWCVHHSDWILNYRSTLSHTFAINCAFCISVPIFVFTILYNHRVYVWKTGILWAFSDQRFVDEFLHFKAYYQSGVDCVSPLEIAIVFISMGPKLSVLWESNWIKARPLCSHLKR